MCIHIENNKFSGMSLSLIDQFIFSRPLKSHFRVSSRWFYKLLRSKKEAEALLQGTLGNIMPT